MIELTDQEKAKCLELIKSISESPRRKQRAQILLKLSEDASMKSIADKLSVSNPTIQKVKDRYLKDGLEASLYDKKRSGRPVTFTEVIKGQILELYRDGSKWTLRTLAKAAEEKQIVKSISHQQVKNILKEKNAI